MTTSNPLTPAQIAKGALRRLAAQQLEPTPEHFAKAYAQEAGLTQAPAQAAPTSESGRAWAQLIERLAKGLERGGKHWTGARKKQSLQRVLDGSRADAGKLQQRLGHLMGAWDDDTPAGEVEPSGLAPLDETPEVAAAEPLAPTIEPMKLALGREADADAVIEASPAAGAESHHRGAAPDADLQSDPQTELNAQHHADRNEDSEAWAPVLHELHSTLHVALPADRGGANELADALGAAAARLAREGAHAALVAEVAQLCERARAHLSHRHLLLDELTLLCRSLTDGLGELAEDESWARGQCTALRERLDEGLSVRGIHAAAEMLAATRAKQHELRVDRERARDALKVMMQRMLAEIGQLGQHTGRFNDNVQRYATTIEQADSLQSLAGVVQEMVTETRAVHDLVDGTRERLSEEHARASELERRVLQLEGELRRLSDEVSTDALTQVANRRGLLQAFEAERARAQRDGGTLAVGLIDIDNFKKLNDSLGHAAGDEALKTLASRTKQGLRPVDHVARFGGEEFVVLLPGANAEEGQQLLTRLQRQLSAGLFMHEGRDVFVTFSAGVTAFRDGEALDAALERADRALYEAKRTGKNRTCLA